MKKTGRVLAALLCLLLSLSAVSALADVIWEPNDDFYNNHRNECEYESRTYITNGKKGYADVFQNPLSSKTVAAFKNGAYIYISFIYTASDGAKWGVVQFTEQDDGETVSSQRWESPSGWVRMGDTVNLYDGKSFFDEFSAELKTYDNEFADYVSDGNPLLLWSYPGSGSLSGEIVPDTDIKEVGFSYTYTDENDRVWCYVPYIYGMEGWACLTDPISKDLPVTPHDYDLIPASEEIPLTGTESSFPTLAVVLVAAVVVITATAIALMSKKKKED